MDERWGLQPEAAAFLLCKYKIQMSSACAGQEHSGSENGLGCIAKVGGPGSEVWICSKTSPGDLEAEDAEAG